MFARLRKWLWLLLTVTAIAIRLAFVATSLRHLPTTSDEANAVLMAKAIFAGERPLLISGQPYQFPLDAYLLAPLVSFMPRNAWGARYLGITLGFLSVVGMLLVLRRSLGPRYVWPGSLLLLFPSTYWLTVQVGTAMPGDPVIGTLSWVMLLAVTVARTSARWPLWLLLAGASGGLACSSHMIVLPWVAAVAIVVCVGRNWLDALTSTAVFVVGAAAGLLPQIVAAIMLPGANQAVLGRLPLAKAVSRLWNPALLWTLPTAMGVDTVLYPDFRDNLGWGGALRLPFAVLYLAVLGAVLGLRLLRVGQRFRQHRWPTLELPDALLGASLLALSLFVLSARADAHTYRYLLPAVWAFPFLVAYVYGAATRPLRIPIGVIAVALAGFNVATSLGVIRAWSRPDFAARAAETPPLTELLAHLRAHGVRHCYATMWLSYRITYETDEAILCSPPYNERFHRWPLPYKTQVDAAPEAVFVLSPAGHRLTSTLFEKDLRHLGVEYDRVTVGPFQVYSNFHHPLADQELVLAGRSLTGSASHSPETAWQLCDGHLETVWCSDWLQATGMWVQAQWSSLGPCNASRCTTTAPSPTTPGPHVYWRVVGQRGLQSPTSGRVGRTACATPTTGRSTESSSRPCGSLLLPPMPSAWRSSPRVPTAAGQWPSWRSAWAGIDG